MNTQFKPGDNLVFQLESGFGVLRVLAVEELEGDTIWHLSVYEDFYADVETAEAALAANPQMPLRTPHIAITNYAFEKTAAARLNNVPVQDEELAAYGEWKSSGGEPSNRSVLMMLGFR
jgi:hypothetical protein